LPIPASDQTARRVPEPIARVADLMSGFRGRWALCGGWAVDAWLGRQARDHHDVDIAVFQDDLAALLDHFAGWQLLAHDSVAPDSTEEWDGRRLYLPAQIHARPGDGFEIDLQVNESSGGAWVLSREPALARAMRRCVEKPEWGLPTLLPEIVLFYKARESRTKDQADFRVLLPRLTENQRLWLLKAIAQVQPGHPWLAQISI